MMPCSKFSLMIPIRKSQIAYTRKFDLLTTFGFLAALQLVTRLPTLWYHLQNDSSKWEIVVLRMWQDGACMDDHTHIQPQIMVKIDAHMAHTATLTSTRYLFICCFYTCMCIHASGAATTRSWTLLVWDSLFKLGVHDSCLMLHAKFFQTVLGFNLFPE